MSELTVRRFTGGAIAPYLSELARLRIAVFREWPYLYDGDMAYEERYLTTYCSSPESLFVLVFDGDRVIGASTGAPMADETDEFKRPFLAHGLDPARIFYFGESVLLPPYRGRGLGVRFFTEREGYARELGRFTHTAFCAVERPLDLPDLDWQVLYHFTLGGAVEDTRLTTLPPYPDPEPYRYRFTADQPRFGNAGLPRICRRRCEVSVRRAVVSQPPRVTRPLCGSVIDGSVFVQTVRSNGSASGDGSDEPPRAGCPPDRRD